MEEQINQPAPQPNSMMPPSEPKSSKVWMIVAIVAIIALVAVSAFGYYKWQQYRTKVGNLGAEINSLKSDIAQKQAATSDKNVVLGLAKASCESQKNFTFILGTVGTNKDQVEFSSDNNSARLVASCQTGTTAVPGSSKTYVFKKANGSWALVITTASPITKAEGEKYNLPTAWYQSSAAPTTTNPTTPTN
jgi:hypothetical protein